MLSLIRSVVSIYVQTLTTNRINSINSDQLQKSVLLLGPITNRIPRVCQPHPSASHTGLNHPPVELVREEESVMFRMTCLCGSCNLVNWVWGRIMCNPSSWSSAVYLPLFPQSCISRCNLQVIKPIILYSLSRWKSQAGWSTLSICGAWRTWNNLILNMYSARNMYVSKVTHVTFQNYTEGNI